MPLVVVHIHFHNAGTEAIAADIKKIIKITTMSQTVLDQLTAKADAAAASLVNIRQDIATIKASLPAEGGMTADEVAILSAKLDAVAGDAAALDSEN
jgi:hypothetical protein